MLYSLGCVCVDVCKGCVWMCVWDLFGHAYGICLDVWDVCKECVWMCVRDVLGCVYGMCWDACKGWCWDACMFQQVVIGQNSSPCVTVSNVIRLSLIHI